MTFPTVEHCKGLAEHHDQQAVLILAVAKDGTVTISTYGADEARCRAIGDWGQGLWTHCVSAVPFQTAFGWGHDGVPTPLSRDEFAKLAPNQQAWAEKYGARP